MRGPVEYRFGPYTLDLFRQQLCCNGQPIALRPKTWAVLVHLVSQAGNLVTPQELLDSVWANTFVTPEVAGVSVRELRKVFATYTPGTRYIQTVARRGYRFVAPVEGMQLLGGDPRAQTGEPTPVPGWFVGRHEELARLHRVFERVREGSRQVLLICGEPGIGKSALLEVFLEQLASVPRQSVLIGRAQCMQDRSEAYLPVLDVLLELCTADRSGQVLRALQRHAPRWLTELPELSAEADSSDNRELPAMTPLRMIRSLTRALEQLSANVPVVLAFDDLQWADPATMEFLQYLGERTEPARILVVLAFRPLEALPADAPLSSLCTALLARGRAAELVLSGLSREAVRAYVEHCHPGLIAADEFAQWLSDRTDGLPLFLRALAEHVVEREASGGQHRLHQAYTQLPAPATIREFVHAEFARLPREEKQLLEALSVCGQDGHAATVAGALGWTVTDTDAKLHALSLRGHLVHASGSSAWPDGTVAGHYQLRHALYAEVISSQIAPTRLGELHSSIGSVLERAFAGRLTDVAADLAVHFSAAHDFARAYRYHRMCAEQALKRQAFSQACSHLEAAREMLDHLPSGPSTSQQALETGTALGGVRMAVDGYGAESVFEAYDWAVRSAKHLPSTPAKLLPLIGMCINLMTRAELVQAQEVADTIIASARRLRLPPALQGLARIPLGHLSFYRGKLATARRMLERASQLLGPATNAFQPEQERALLWIDPFVSSLNVLKLALATASQTAAAERTSQKALRRARALGHPFTLIAALDHAALLGFVLADWPRARDLAGEALELAKNCGFPFWIGSASIVLGHAQAKLREPERGLATLQQGLDIWAGTGTRLGTVLYSFMHADVHALLGRDKEAEALLRAALHAARDSQERIAEAEVWRLLGQLSLRRNQRRRAAGYYRKAIGLARAQGAALWQHRAQAELARI